MGLEARERYRFRRPRDGKWSRERRLWRIMRMVQRQQARHGKTYRARRREEEWSAEYQLPRPFRKHLRKRLDTGPTGVFQFQVGGIYGPVTGILKYHKAPAIVPVGEKVIAAAITEIGTPYRFGEANGPEDPGTDAFDCSGFTQWAWGTVGKNLPHSANWQMRDPGVTRFFDETNCKPGDLVFMWFPNNRGLAPWEASHVGLWVRPGVVIDTRNPINAPVAIRPADGVIGYGRLR